MSTRCQVIVKDKYEEIWFYRHSDGYPEGVKETLSKFLQWINEGKIRNNASQSAGWLVMIGSTEYSKGRLPGEDEIDGWQVGAYEPCSPKLHGDIEYLYIVDVEKKSIEAKEVKYDENYNMEKNHKLWNNVEF